MKTDIMVLVPKRLLRCYDTAEFIRAVHDRMDSTKSTREAYEDLEEEFETHFNRRRFKDFNTFRVMVTRHNKKKRNKK